MEPVRTTRRSLRLAVTVGGLAAATLLAAPMAPAAAAVTTTTVTGTVHGAGGVLLQDVVVSASSHGLFINSATTRRDGTYSFEAVHGLGTDLQITFSAQRAVGGTSATGYADQCYRASSSCSAVDITHVRNLRANATLPRAATLRGRVTDSLGRGVGGLVVQARDSGFSSEPGHTTTDVNGNYSLSRVNPGAVILEFGDFLARPQQATPAVDGYEGRETSTTVGSGQTAVFNQVVTGGGAVVGTVVDESGTPIAGATVTADQSYAAGGSFPSTVTNAHGGFRLGYLAAGPTTICASVGDASTCDGDHPSSVWVRELRGTRVTLVVPGA